MSKPPREFSLYFCTDDDGTISPYGASICENSVKWQPGCGWAEPDAHVIEKSAYDELHQSHFDLSSYLNDVEGEKLKLIAEKDELIGIVSALIIGKNILCDKNDNLHLALKCAKDALKILCRPSHHKGIYKCETCTILEQIEELIK